MVDNLSTEAQIERLQQESRSCTYPTDAAAVKKRYKDTALILFKEDLEDGSLRNYLTFGTRRSSAVSQYGNTPIVIRRSCSSNGELATVAEQVPTLQGRSTRSNYTLLEATEKEKETDSDDGNYFHESRFNSDESFAVGGNQEVEPRFTADLNDSVKWDQEAKASTKNDTRSTSCLQETTSAISEQSQDHGTQKSLSYNDPHMQQCRESTEREIIQPYEDNAGRHGSKRLSKDSKNATSEAAAHGGSQQTTTKAHRASMSSQDAEHDLISQPPEDDNNSQPTCEGNEVSHTFLQNTTKPTPTICSISVQDTEIDHEAILRDYVQQPQQQSKSLFQDEVEANHCTPETVRQEESSENPKLLELKIIESTDSLFKQTDTGISVPDVQKSLTTSDIPHLTDESDVVFIDAGSPSLSRTKLFCEASSESNEEVLELCSEGAGNSPKALNILDKPPVIPQTAEPDPACKKQEIKREDISRRRHNSHNSFRDLPIRSPTPPRRRPQRSPRTPKLREKTRQRHSSLALASDEENQELLANGTRSASPTSKTGDFRFFSFSLKKEKSRSATSLGSKRNRERVKLTSVKLSLEDPGAINPMLVPSHMEDDHLENSEKRVGVRSVMIDGTIKQNFIVIHPSDNSETIGLAPKSLQANQKELIPASTPEALSTVRARITASSTEKLDIMKRKSCQGGLKEELSDIPENMRNESRGSFRTFNFSQVSRSLRIKQNKKNWEHMPLRGSHSLSSEPVCPSPSSSQILYKSPSSLSEVDCDSLTASAQKLHAGDSRTVSKLCVVM